MRRDDGGEFWLRALGGAILGVVGQLVSDAITSAIDGEFQMSSFSTYLGAAVGGAVSAIIPGSNSIAKDIAGSVVSTVTGMIGENVQNSITGNEERNSFEQIFCATVHSTVLTTLGSSFARNRKTDIKVKEIYISRKADITWQDVFSEGVNSLLNGFRSSIPGRFIFASEHN